MSRIGKKPIAVPDKVKVEINPETVVVTGPKGSVTNPIPPGIKITVDKQTHLVISGVDRQQVGQIAANIRSLKKPDPYKNKGIRYVGEVLKKKAGKAGGK